MPCCDPPQMERQSDTGYKNIRLSDLSDIKQPVAAWPRNQRRTLAFWFGWLLDYLLQFQLSDALCINLRFLVFTLQNYTSIHIFSFKF